MLGRLIWSALSATRARGLLVISGVGASTLLIVALLAVRQGLTHGVESYVGSPSIDLWIAPRGTDNLIRSSAVVPQQVLTQLTQTAQVDSAGCVLRGFATAKRIDASNERGLTLLLMGYDTTSGLGGPPRLVRGAAPTGLADITLDAAAAVRLRVDVGSVLSISDQTFRVAAITRGTNLIATQLGFLPLAGAAKLVGMTGLCSFIALRAKPGADLDGLQADLSRSIASVSVFSRSEFVHSNTEEVAAGFLPIIVLLGAVGALAAAVFVALLVHGLVEQHRRDIAVLLALGAELKLIVAAFVAELLLLLVAGALLGTCLLHVLAWALDRFRPTVELAPEPSHALLALCLLLAAGAVAAFGPLYRLGRIDPAEAFRP